MLPHPICSHKATSRPSTPQAGSIVLKHAYNAGGSQPSRVFKLWSALQAQPATDAPTAGQPAATAVDPPQPAKPLECEPSTSQTASQESKYLSYQDYTAMQEAAHQQQQEHQSSAEFGQRADETAHASSSAPTSSSSGKRVPWNKGRKHSARMIARITEATALALARPEVKAKLDAWNQSRVGTKRDEHIKLKIAEKQRASMAAKFQNMSAEELEEFSSKRSALAKRLWQDPAYVAKTVTAIQEAGQRRRETSAQQAADADGDSGHSSSSAEGSSSASSAGSSSSSKRGSRRRAARTSSSQAADSEAAVEAGAAAERPVPKEPRRVHTPTKKELAATARAQLQERLDKLLHTQLVVARTEQTVQQVRSSLAAFENNPQAKEQAAATLQQAESYLGPAKRLVSKLAKDLQDHGVCWDPHTGQMTHIYDEPVEQFLRASGAAGGTKARSSSSGVSSKASRSSGSSSRAGSRREAAGAADIGPDVVRSSRSTRQQQGNTGAAEGLIVSSRRRGAVAEAAAGGGVRVSSAGSAATWTPVNSAAAGGPVPANGSNGNGKNGHSPGSNGASYVPVRVQRSLDSVDDVDVDAE